MADEAPAERATATRFVRETLGCGCGEEVFRQLETSRDLRVAGVPVAWRIDVGHRLLVYVLEVSDVSDLEPRLGTLVRFGRAERDARGFNRLRLVVSTENPAGLSDQARRIVERSGAADERVHLHVLPRAAVPPACA